MKPVKKSVRISTCCLTIVWICAIVSGTLAQSTTAPGTTIGGSTASGSVSGSSQSQSQSTKVPDQSTSSGQLTTAAITSAVTGTRDSETTSFSNSSTSETKQGQSTTPTLPVSTSDNRSKSTDTATTGSGTTPQSKTETTKSQRRASKVSGDNQDNQSIFDADRSFGQLCAEENDEVGRKLGCDCKYSNGNNIALCSNRQIKIGSKTIPLPNKLNVSSHITILDLSWNAIERIDATTFNEVESITDLNLSRNRITLIDGLNFTRLQSLDLSYNGIANVSASFFKNTPKLLKLDLSHNNLTFIDVATFTAVEYLQVLKLGFNPLENIHNYMEIYPFILNNMTYLEELDLTNGSLPDFPEFVLQGTTNLKRLILKNNLLSYLPTGAFSQLPLLEELDLSGNYFANLPPSGFEALGHLKSLFLDRGRILERIDEFAFSGLHSLITLSCENNYHLSYIDVRAFRGNPATNASECNPKEVRLSYNNLNYFEYPLLKWPTVESIELFGNPWMCDCNLQWVSEFSRHDRSNASVLIDRDFICEGPKHSKGAPVVDVEPNEMYCDSPEAMVAGIIAIAVVSLVLICFVVMIVLYQFQMLPEGIEKFIGVLKDRTRSSLPKYSKVQPKPSGIRHHRLVNHRSPENPSELDWDTGDIGHLNY